MKPANPVPSTASKRAAAKIAGRDPDDRFGLDSRSIMAIAF
jgi:hypothetical protein